MRTSSRIAAAVAVAGLAVLVGAAGSRHPSASGQAQQAKDTPRVAMFDSPVNFTPGNEYEGSWGFTPAHLAVHQGEQIEFDNPVGNNYPHTVTSITWSAGPPPHRQLTVGAAFDSSPTPDQYLMPGGSFVLDTSTLDPGQYLYYCTIHPWMVGSITVEPAATSVQTGQ